MSTSRHLPSWFPPMSIAACALIIGLISFVWHLVPFIVTSQAFLLIMILRAWYYWPPMARWITTIPIPHRVVFGAMIGAMILGHYTQNGRTYFPFVSWEIFPFVHEDDPVTCREFIATTNDGHKVRLLVEQLFPSIVQVDPIDSMDDPRYYPAGTTEHLARTLAKVYNEHHTDDPVWRVDLMELAVKLHPAAGESPTQPSCELLKRYELSSGQ